MTTGLVSTLEPGMCPIKGTGIVVEVSVNPNTSCCLDVFLPRSIISSSSRAPTAGPVTAALGASANTRAVATVTCVWAHLFVSMCSRILPVWLCDVYTGTRAASSRNETCVQTPKGKAALKVCHVPQWIIMFVMHYTEWETYLCLSAFCCWDELYWCLCLKRISQ